jgi:hypothetical protein
MLKMRLAMSWSGSFLCRCPCTGGLKHQRSSKDKDKACPGLVRPFTTIEVDMCCDKSSFEQFFYPGLQVRDHTLSIPNKIDIFL